MGVLAAVCVAAAIVGAVGILAFTTIDGSGAHATGSAQARRPGQPNPGIPAHVCGNPAVLGGGPAHAPSGAVVVPAGSDAGVDFTVPGTTYWFAPGRHTLGPGQYTQIMPGTGATFLGAPGAVLDGAHTNYYAFGGYASDVTIKYLTIENFGVSGGNQNEGVVNTDSAAGWTIARSTITGNAGAGVMLGSRNTLSYDCLADNQQYGFNAYSPSGPSALVLDHNEIAGNDSYNYQSRQPDCGCSGGGKFWDVDGAVVTNNWVHDNLGPGLWADTDNRGFDFTGNYISGNYSYGLIYEISYNALITHNTFVRNGLGEGPKNPAFPTSAIYISESGSDARVQGPYGGTLSITQNSFTDNWSGVILWENANRFCGSPANTSTSYCTLVDPGVANLRSCVSGALARAPLASDCRWETRNVLVSGNVFTFSPSSIGPDCTPGHSCGLQGLFSEYGSYPSWSPYKGTVVEQHITLDQNNHFTSNVYIGPWKFMVYQQDNVVSWATWRGKPYLQDQGSSLTTHG